MNFDEHFQLFPIGSPVSNMYALAVARHKLIPQVKFKGMSGIKERLVIFAASGVRA